MATGAVPVGQPDLAAGCATIPPDKLGTWVPLLVRLYKFEASLVSGSGSSRRDIQACLWSVDQLRAWLGIGTGTPEEAELASLIHHLYRQRQIMKIPPADGLPERYLTRVAETVRILGHTYEFWWRGRPGVDAVRWLAETKWVPRRDIPAADYLSRIVALVGADLPAGAIPPALQPAVAAAVAAVGGELSVDDDWRNALFSKFQLDSAVKILGSQIRPQGHQPAQILTAGVGSGKTAAFLVPVVTSAVMARLGPRPSPQVQLLLYPRQALARDQFQTLRRITQLIPGTPLEVWLDHTSAYEREGLSVIQGLDRHYAPTAPHIDIIVLTLETLKRRLQYPAFVRRMASGLTRVVLDEIHLASGVQGAHIALLMTRLKQIAPNRRIHWTAASATVAVPQDHASRIFGLRRREVELIRVEEGELAEDGLAHHVFLRPSSTISSLGILVNATSLLVHSRREGMSTRGETPQSDRGRPKTIGFADSLDLLGRWNGDLRENERTESSRMRPHPEDPPFTDWTTLQRELPYPLRYRRPLDRRIRAEGGVPDAPGDALGQVLVSHRSTEVCGACLAGQRITLETSVPAATMAELGKLVYRSPHSPTDKVKKLAVSNPVFGSSQPIGTLDLCPYLRAGACLWFGDDVADGPSAVAAIPGLTRRPRYEWKDVARSTVYTARSTSTDGDDLAEVVYRESIANVYDVGPHDSRIGVDVVLASPSLEVGVDLPMLTESIMTKAIRNVATYRQKAGRVGRETGLDAVNVTLVTDSPLDLHYYRQLRKLVSLGRLDPIPLKDKNEAVVKSAVYSAIWDWLAVKGDLPEVIPRTLTLGRTTAFTQALGRCLGRIRSDRPGLGQTLGAVSRGAFSPTGTEIAAAISQAEAEIGLLLEECSGTLEETRVTGEFRIADAFVLRLNNVSVRSRADPAALRKFYESLKQYLEVRAGIPPDRPDLVESFKELDRAQGTGSWNSTIVTAAVAATRGWCVANPSDPLHDDIEGLASWALPRMQSALADLERRGINLRQHYAFDQFDKLCVSSIQRAHYLSYVLQSLPVFGSERRDNWFVRPENLYTNPYERTTAILDEQRRPIDNVPVPEALFGFVPGTWTYRLPGGPYKVKTGALEFVKGGPMRVNLDSVAAATGASFRRLTGTVPDPFDSTRELSVYEPAAVAIFRVPYGKYVVMDPVTHRVLDQDEAETSRSADEAGGHRTPHVKIPKSYLSQWVNVVSPGETPAGLELPVDPDEGTLAIQDGEVLLTGAQATERVRHPLSEALFEGIRRHDRLHITEFVTSASRSYSGRAAAGVELAFSDSYGDAALGTKYPTEGLSFDLKRDLVEELVADVSAAMVRGTPEWTASLLRAVRALIQSESRAAGNPLSAFLANDVISVLLQSLWPLESPPSFGSLKRGMDSLSNDGERLRALADAHSRKKRGLLATDDESLGGSVVGPDEASVVADTERLVEGVKVAAAALGGETALLERWIRRTLLTSFGVTSLLALQKFSGATEDEIGFDIGPGPWDGTRDPRVYLFDRSIFGNGSTETARSYLHLPHILRHGETEWSKLLPSEDYLSALEEELMQCLQFHADSSALVMLDGSHAVGIAGLRDVEDQARDVYETSSPFWNRMGVLGFGDAWRLPIAREMVGFLEDRLDVHRDDLIRATTICWNGCPECVVLGDGGTGGLEGRAYVDKAILDRWFQLGRHRSSEYRSLAPSLLITQGFELPLGRQHSVVFDRGTRRLRSVSLPWTLGFEIDRGATSPALNLVLRCSDVSGMPAPLGGGASVGMSAMALKRLLWFDLLSSAYLDVLGLLQPDDKHVEFLSYDMSDLWFDDVGLSPRMLGSVSAVAAMDRAPVDFQRLSDLIEWLLRRRFRVTICVDRQKAQDSRVATFLRKVASVPGGTATILTNELEPERGLFHPKVLVTPVGALRGSANITEAGSGRNDEMIDYAGAGSPEYDAIRLRVADLLQGGVPWVDRPSGST